VNIQLRAVIDQQAGGNSQQLLKVAIADRSLRLSRFDPDDVAFYDGRNNFQAAYRHSEATARLYIELPAMTYAMKKTVSQVAIREGPMRVRAAVKKRADATVCPNENNRRSVALHAEGALEWNLV
jgi:hypothetical protein